MSVRIAFLLALCVALPACEALRVTPNTTPRATVRPVPGVPSAAPAASTGAASTGAASAADATASSVRPVVYRFGIGDELGIDVWQEAELSTTQRVLRDGTVAPMLLGTVNVQGKTIDEVDAELTEKYTKYLKDPQVSIRVTGIYTDRVFVLGEVGEPQAVELLGPLSVVQAIAQADGFNEEFADKSGVRLIRVGPDGQANISVVNVDAVLGGRLTDTLLQRGDVLYIPARGVTNWSRTIGQALAPFATAIGVAGTIAAVTTATE